MWLLVIISDPNASVGADPNVSLRVFRDAENVICVKQNGKEFSIAEDVSAIRCADPDVPGLAFEAGSILVYLENLLSSRSEIFFHF